MNINDLEEILAESSRVLRDDIGFEICKSEVSFIVGNNWVDRRVLKDYNECDKAVISMLGTLISEGVKATYKNNSLTEMSEQDAIDLWEVHNILIDEGYLLNGNLIKKLTKVTRKINAHLGITIKFNQDEE